MKIYQLLDNYDVLPNKTGIYYFYDKDDHVLYIGKAVNIRNRIRNHLRNFQIMSKFKKGIELCDLFIEKYNQGNYDNSLYEEIIDFEVELRYSLAFHFKPVNIDYVFDIVDHVGIIEMVKEKIKEFEEMEISRLSPPYNFQSMNVLYNEAEEKYWEFSTYFGKKFEEVKRLAKDHSS